VFDPNIDEIARIARLRGLPMYRFVLLALSIVLISTLYGPLHADDQNKKKGQNKVPPAQAWLMTVTPEQFIKRFDKNNDGFLTKDELPPRFAAIFERADQNGDGKLDVDEVGQMLQVVRQNIKANAKAAGQGKNADIERRVADVFYRLDTNKDGKISRQEAQGPLLKNFDQIDRNKDGFLDKEEVRQALQRFAQKAPDTAKGKTAEIRTAPQRRIPDFDAFDLDADGVLSKEEWQKTRFSDSFDAIDANKDGRIDRKEFEAYFQKQAERLDREEAKDKERKKQ
jgi:Ca2+-binding EF-hand superfamily protein